MFEKIDSTLKRRQEKVIQESGKLDRVKEIYHLWDAETSDPGTWSWRTNLTTNELLLISYWDRAVVITALKAVGAMANIDDDDDVDIEFCSAT